MRRLHVWSIEVDGALHLGDADAYRRDRRKDRLLQENGYTVLRFLAEDLAKDLDTVLDAVLRSLAGSIAGPLSGHHEGRGSSSRESPAG